jgi:hypothetical protein
MFAPYTSISLSPGLRNLVQHWNATCGNQVHRVGITASMDELVGRQMQGDVCAGSLKTRALVRHQPPEALPLGRIQVHIGGAHQEDIRHLSLQARDVVVVELGPERQVRVPIDLDGDNATFQDLAGLNLLQDEGLVLQEVFLHVRCETLPGRRRQRQVKDVREFARAPRCQGRWYHTVVHERSAHPCDGDSAHNVSKSVREFFAAIQQ